MGEAIQKSSNSHERHGRLASQFSALAGWSVVGIIAHFFGILIIGGAVALVMHRVFHVNVSQPAWQLPLSLVAYSGIIGFIVWLAKRCKRPFSWNMIGLERLMTLRDLLWMPLGAIIYLLLAIGLISLVSALVPAFNAQQVQETGIGNIYGIERGLVFLALVVVAPVAEEIIFRGMLYGQMRRTTLPWWVPALVISAVFGLVHLQWNVGLDVACLSMVMCALREYTGAIWSGMLLHMLKNGIAFFALFILPGV